MGNNQSVDLRKRRLKVLRLSLKQNCNFSCIYCKPENYNIDVLNTTKDVLGKNYLSL